ncbi:MAG: galactokinase [Anaerolineales bacterium]|nr:galactokinase [Chloroflexota bacterium]MBL6981573.1 galactokinase [Anaerolineales bacterium]
MRKELIKNRFENQFSNTPEIIVQAPGRVDLMGSHTDYNLGYVLTQAIDRNTWIAARPRQDKIVRIASLNVEGTSEFHLDDIQHDTVNPWTNYVRGVADILQKEGYELTGFDGLIHSTIPFGSGLSSSAALEVASAILFEALADWEIDPVQIAVLCQRAENGFVGMNCGILDQYSSAMGVANSVVLLDCRSITHEIKPIADGVQVMICDTKAERALTGSEYSERRAQCEEGVRILSQFYPEIRSLRDATLGQLAAHKADIPPVVFKRCQFIIEENQRVLDMAAALADGRHEDAGQLALRSFDGARDLYEIVSSEMIAMKDAITGAPGVFGARGAGAGFGGCLVAFVREGEIDTFSSEVLKKYTDFTGIDADVYPVIAASGAGLVLSRSHN